MKNVSLYGLIALCIASLGSVYGSIVNSSAKPTALAIVRLKNGVLVNRALLVQTIATLTTLTNANETTRSLLKELVSSARDSKYTLTAEALQHAHRYALIKSDGTMDDSIKAIIIAVISGKGSEMQVVIPLEEEAEKVQIQKEINEYCREKIRRNRFKIGVIRN